MANPTKRNLLICLDAFGTIFTPREPIAAQYGGVARSSGVAVSDEQVGKAFKQAFKEETKAHPNFGKAVGLGANKWWTNVITKTLQPFHPTPLPETLAQTLISRFSTKEAYKLYPDVQQYFRLLSKSAYRIPHSSNGTEPRIIVGVITNTDDSVPKVLTSLGLRVNKLRYGDEIPASHSSTETQTQTRVVPGLGSATDSAKPELTTISATNELESKSTAVLAGAEGVEEKVKESPKDDIDFTILSYDTGVSKPNPEIFSAATQTLISILSSEQQIPRQQVRLDDWDFLHIGDEIEKDGVGAVRAGWGGVVVDRGSGDGVSYKTRLEGGEVDVISDFEALGQLRREYPLILG